MSLAYETDADVLDVIERELGRARDDVRRVVERFDALTDLRTLALELIEHGPIDTLDALRAASHRDPVTAARFATITTRLNQGATTT